MESTRKGSVITIFSSEMELLKNKSKSLKAEWPQPPKKKTPPSSRNAGL